MRSGHQQQRPKASAPISSTTTGVSASDSDTGAGRLEAGAET